MEEQSGSIELKGKCLLIPISHRHENVLLQILCIGFETNMQLKNLWSELIMFAESKRIRKAGSTSKTNKQHRS